MDKFIDAIKEMEPEIRQIPTPIKHKYYKLNIELFQAYLDEAIPEGQLDNDAEIQQMLVNIATMAYIFWREYESR